MKTKIKTIHEEQISDGSRTFGVLLNYTYNENEKKINIINTLFYSYREGTYVFFETMTDMYDHTLYGDSKIKRAYLEEDEFDRYYDVDGVNGHFSDLLSWN